MKTIVRSCIFSAALLAAACAPQEEAPLDGAWTLDGSASRVTFTTVKNGLVAEGHGFRSLSGTVGADGAASLTIDLASVATNVDIRDERMREFLFETGAYPKARVTAQLDPAAFAALKTGESMVQPVEATLDLHGVQGEVEAELAVTRIAAGKVKVEAVAPIIIDAPLYGLDGLAKLKELAGLDSIAPQVPVSLSLTFEKAE